ncbi:MAG: hypothetical protein E7405_04950 [Ruminococcaceae bacterium]|nr:hypothetical protein [Oscillospiraceae bacterium]
MKRYAIIIFTLIIMMVFTGCKEDKKNLYLPELTNDKIYTTIGGKEKQLETKTEFCLVSKTNIIEINSDIEKLNMEPLSVEHGAGDGFKWTIHKYSDIEIKTLLSDNNKSVINKISTKSPVYRTIRYIGVGDSVSKLIDSYKNDLEYSWSIEKSYYVFDPQNDIGFKRIFFYIDNDIINEIIIEDGIDG